MIVLRTFLFLATFLYTQPVSSELANENAVYVGSNVYEPTVDRWKKSMSSLSPGSTSWIWSQNDRDPKHLNKSRDSILWVPNSSHPQDITLIVWFHGCKGFTKKTFKKRILPQIEEVSSENHSVAVAIPELPWSNNTRTKCSRQGKVWKKPGSFENYVNEVKERLDVWSIMKHKMPLGNVRIVLVGHSAGGSAIMSASEEGSLCKIKPEVVVWSDASYASWLPRAWASCLKDPDIEVRVLVRKWDKPHHRVKKFLRKIGKNVENISVDILERKSWTHGSIGNNAIWLSGIFEPGC